MSWTFACQVYRSGLAFLADRYSCRQEGGDSQALFSTAKKDKRKRVLEIGVDLKMHLLLYFRLPIKLRRAIHATRGEQLI